MRNNGEEAPLDLSILLTVVSGNRALRRCLEALCQQADFSTTEIIVPYDKWSVEVGDLAADFPEVGFHFVTDLGSAESNDIPAHQHRLYDRRRAVGLARARGRIIAMSEDHAIPAPDWCRQVIEAHKQPFAVIGGAIDNAVDKPLNWAVYYCDFGRYGSPLESGPSEYVSDVNLAYKRDALVSVRDIWAESYHETTVHWSLLARGEVVFRDPRMVVYQHRPLPPFWRLCKERVEWGRIFAETRVAESGLWKRLLYIIGTPLLPFLLLKRLVGHMSRQKRSALQILTIAPLAACLLACWAFGELLGYLAGVPASIQTATVVAPRLKESSGK